MFQRVLLESGQFILKEKVELDVEAFKVLVNQVLSIYNHYVPIEKHLFKEVNYSRQYIFTDTNTVEGVPENIVDLIPVRIWGVYPFYLRGYDRPKTYLDIKIEFPWEYRKPILTVPVSAEYDLHAIYFHKMREANCIVQVDTIDDTHQEFFRLLTGKFLKALGRSRRAFTLTDLPITIDADNLVREGEEMEMKAMENISSNVMKWYLAWR